MRFYTFLSLLIFTITNLCSEIAPHESGPQTIIDNKVSVLTGNPAIVEIDHVVPSVIENAVKVGRKSANKVPGRLEYYDPINRLKVVTEANGEIVTIIPGRG